MGPRADTTETNSCDNFMVTFCMRFFFLDMHPQNRKIVSYLQTNKDIEENDGKTKVCRAYVL